MKGRDGLVRGATVKVATKDEQNTVLNRPIQLLFPLEVQSQEPVSEEDPEPEVTETSSVPEDDNLVEESPEPATSEGAPRCSQRAAAQ